MLSASQTQPDFIREATALWREMLLLADALGGDGSERADARPAVAAKCDAIAARLTKLAARAGPCWVFASNDGTGADKLSR